MSCGWSVLVVLLLWPNWYWCHQTHNHHHTHYSNYSAQELHRLDWLSSLRHSGSGDHYHNHNHHLDSLFRHSNKYLDRINVDNVSSISELIEKLRGMRGRGRRSHGANVTLAESRKGNMTWPLKRVAVIDGNIWLGGLMMVHEREDEIICGPIMPQGGIQALETMLYTIDWINNQKDFLPGIKIGVHILDDCDKDTYGLEQAVDFIKGSISNIDEEVAKCSDGESPVGQKHNVIAGVVGAASSVTSIQVANLLRLFKIPQVSFFSTSPELSNKGRFEFFSRTIPSDKNQVKVMVELLKTFGWTYVSIIYEESNYGIKAFEELEKLLPENNICIATKEKLVKDSGVAGEAIYERIVDKLLATHKAKGVIVFGSDQEVKDLMKAVGKRNATGHFSWIGSDGWSARALVSDGNEPVVEGTLSVQPRANPVKGFDSYFFRLRSRTNLRNPWFQEFWEHHWECKFPNSSRTPYNGNYDRTCTGDERLSAENTVFEDQLQYVSDAVMSFAYAFKDMHQDLCNGTYGLCQKMNPIDGTELLNYLRKVRFEGLSGDKFHFDEWQDGPARYNIIHFRRNGNSYHWVRVGDYNEGLLNLNMSAIRFAGGSSEAPTSVCSEPCQAGEAKQYFGGDKCCWSCIKCLNAYIVDPEDESNCFECHMGTLPDDDHIECVPIHETYLRPTDGVAIGAMTLAGVGCIITGSIIVVFICHNDTPVVRASSRELSYTILAALFSCFALTFLFVIRPSDVVCGVQLFFTGFVFTVPYAALLTKTNRIARIFKAGRKSAKRPSFISPKSQIIICVMLVFIQTLIAGMLMIVERPKASYFYPTRADNFLVCEAYINHSYVVAFFYPLLIILVCTVYAVLTRKIPGDFNESKCIGFTMYTTCIIWLAFVPIYFSTGTQVAMRVTSMTVAISLSAYVMIVCLLGPKLYIILFHPERNVRQSMMAPSTRLATLSTPTNATPTLQLATLKNHVDSASPKVPRVDASTQSEDFVPASSDPIVLDKDKNLKSNVVHPVESCGTQTEDRERKNCECDLSPSSTLMHRFSFKRERGECPSDHKVVDGRTVQILMANDTADVML